MSFKEVKELRLQGKLNEALQLAENDLNQDPKNLWNIRSISWVYYDIIKSNIERLNFSEIYKNLDKILSLELSEEDKTMLHDKVVVQIGKAVFALNSKSVVNYIEIDFLFNYLKQFNFPKASFTNTFIIKAFLKGSSGWNNLFSFIDFIGFDSFQESDYTPEEFNERALPAVVEKFYNVYAKKLIASANLLDTTREDFENRVNLFLPHLNKLIATKKEYQFLPYFKAKLFILLNKKDEVLRDFLPFAKRKKNDFWVWELIAELYEKSDKNKIACYCKALSLKSPEEYLVGTRIHLAELLIFHNKYEEAKFEIEKSIFERTKQGWKIPNQIISYTNMDWFKKVKSTENNFTFYKKHLPTADKILFEDIEEEIVVVEFVNKEKQILNFVKDKNRSGFFSYKGILKNPQIGDILKVRLDGNTNVGRSVALSVLIDNTLVSDAIESFEGTIKKNEDKDFAFVHNFFIEPSMVKKEQLISGQKVMGKAILTLNKKKNSWGWKVFSIEKM